MRIFGHGYFSVEKCPLMSVFDNYMCLRHRLKSKVVYFSVYSRRSRSQVPKILTPRFVFDFEIKNSTFQSEKPTRCFMLRIPCESINKFIYFVASSVCFREVGLLHLGRNTRWLRVSKLIFLILAFSLATG